eukprot:TRINITY_DN27924_c0_g2_i2.p1 TRINITY_DN27924_c0_g2~~TRINITY_DN27924_c0_g2_i2.p1  ORF type:complete len:141 (-),score=49.26 TRINITY_DN27924_c0_g2_i2:76-498(-)
MDRHFSLYASASPKPEAECHQIKSEQPLLEALAQMQMHHEELTTVRFCQHLMIPPPNFKHLSISHLQLTFSQLSNVATQGSFVIGSLSYGIKLAALHLYHSHGSQAPSDLSASMATAYQIQLPALLEEYAFLCKLSLIHI